MILGKSIMTTRQVLKSDPEELTNEPPAEESFSQKDQSAERGPGDITPRSQLFTSKLDDQVCQSLLSGPKGLKKKKKS